MITPVLGTFEKTKSPEECECAPAGGQLVISLFTYLLLKETGLNKVKTKKPAHLETVSRLHMCVYRIIQETQLPII